jgi:creatinine amidohydrolase/Fe(II)-dependent formamide hydrolase-like protein
MEAPQSVRWESLTKRQFDEIDRSRAVVLITCSPLEVHGPHLPLGADALEGEGLSERMLRFLPERHRDRTFLKLPFIYAATDTVPQPGSLYFQPSTTVTVLCDLARTLGAQGFRHVMVGNFHGGPRHFLAIERACEKANRRYGTRMVSLFSLLISRLTNGTSNLDDTLAQIPGVEAEDLQGDTHGGIIETSQLLALHGDWVDPDYKSLPRQTVETWLADQGRAKASPGSRGDPRRFFSMLQSYKDGLAFFDRCTYSGSPGKGSAEIGEQILDVLGGHAAQAVSELLDGEIGPEDCHSPVWKLRFLFLNPWMIRLSNRLLGFRNAIA